MPDVTAKKIDKWLQGRAAAALAESVSLCVRVEPELLRAIRYELHPRLSVDAEAAVWFSPLVEARNALGIVFRPGALTRLRAALAGDQDRLKQAWKIVEAHHVGITPAVALEERLTWLALSEPQPGGLWEQWNQEVERGLQSLLAALVREDRRGLASWAARALPLLPDLPRHRALLDNIAHAAMLRGAPRIALVGTAVSSQTPAWLVPKTGLARVAVEFTYVNVQPIVGKLRFFYPAPPNTPGLDVRASAAADLSIFSGSGPPIPANRVEVRVEYKKLQELHVDGREARIRVAGGREYLVSAVEKSRRQQRIFLNTVSSEMFALGHFVRYHLAADGYDVFWTQDMTMAATYERVVQEILSRDIFVAVGPQDPATNRLDKEVNIAREACRLIIWLRTGPGTGSTEAIAVGNEATWPGAVKVLIEKLQQPRAPLGVLEGVAELPSPYLPRPLLLQKLIGMLLDPASTMVLLEGPAAAGQRTLAIAAARSCEIRRGFPGGIRWPHDASSWEETASPRLFIVDSPNPGHYDALARTAQSYKDKGSRILVLHSSVDRFWGFPVLQIPYLRHQEMISGMQQIAGTNIWIGPDLIAKVTEGWPHRVVNAALLWKAAEKSSEFAAVAKDLTNRLYSQDETVTRAREFLAHAATVCSLAAFKPDTSVTPEAAACLAMDENARASALKMLESCGLLIWSENGNFKLDRRIPALLGESEPARAAEARLLQAYLDRNGGDWIAGLTDVYFASALAFHLSRQGMSGVQRDLLLDLDYIEARAKGDPNELLDDLQMLVPPADWAAEYRAPFSALSVRYGRSSITGLMSTFPFKAAELQILRTQILERRQLRVSPPHNWVLVVGTGAYELPPAVLWASRALGRELARYSFGLVTGGWQGVDYVTADEYVNELRRIGVSPDTAVRHVVRGNGRPDFPIGIVIESDNDIEGGVSHAHAVVAIGGQGATLQICQFARTRGIPVFPISGTGGDADQFFLLSNPGAKLPQPIATPVEAWHSAKQAVRAIVTMLQPAVGNRPLSDRA